MAYIRDDEAFRGQLARECGRRATSPAAVAVGARASALLAAHRETGSAQIVVEHGAVDSYVVLDDPASLSIEFGRGEYTRGDGRRVGAMEGLHVLSRAVHS
jgi:hypothetical protein